MKLKDEISCFRADARDQPGGEFALPDWFATATVSYAKPPAKMLVVNVNGVIDGLLQSMMNGALVAPAAKPVAEATM